MLRAQLTQNRLEYSHAEFISFLITMRQTLKVLDKSEEDILT